MSENLDIPDGDGKESQLDSEFKVVRRRGRAGGGRTLASEEEDEDPRVHPVRRPCVRALPPPFSYF